MRMIDADAVLDRYYEEFEKQDICDGSQDRDWLMRCIEEAPTLTPPNEWISTDKCTPEPMKDVLVMFENGIMCVGFTYYDYRLLNRWSIHIDHALYQPCPINPKYWTLLPKPPKGTEDVAFSATTKSGCEYCSGDPMRPLDWQYGLDHIFPDYKYCPMCGRYLKGKNENECK